jgi:hypothetical protein
MSDPSSSEVSSTDDTHAKACNFEVIAPQLQWVRGSPNPADGAPRLDHSLQLEECTQVLLEWEVEEGASVELDDPAAPGPQILDASVKSFVVTPNEAVAEHDYVLCAFRDGLRSPPMVIHVSTHPAGAVVSGHVDCAPPPDALPSTPTPIQGRGLSPFLVYTIGRLESNWGAALKNGTGDDIPRWVKPAKLNSTWFANPTGRKAVRFSMNGVTVSPKSADGSADGASPALTVGGGLSRGLTAAAAIAVTISKGGTAAQTEISVAIDGDAGAAVKLKNLHTKSGLAHFSLTGKAAGFTMSFKMKNAAYVAGETYSFTSCTEGDLTDAKYPDDVPAARLGYDKKATGPFYNTDDTDKVEVAPPAIPCASIASPSAGFGYGLMQYDAASHWTWLTSHDWGDPAIMVGAGVELFLTYRNAIATAEDGDHNPLNVTGAKLIFATLCAYNAGPGPVIAELISGGSGDNATYGKNYGTIATGFLNALLGKYTPPAGEATPVQDDDASMAVSSAAAKLAFTAALKALKEKSKPEQYAGIMLAVGAPPS